jgi:hypothetical protein
VIHGVVLGTLFLLAFTVIGIRIASVFWEPPVGPTIAFASACLVGIVVAAAAGRRLARTTRSEHVVG